MRLTSFRKTLSLMVLCPLLFAASLSAGDVCAQETARIYPEPAQALVGEGQTTMVEVRIENVQNLYALDIRLSFDPAVVEVADADPAEDGIQVRPGDLLSVDFTVKNVADNDQGTVWVALTQLNPSEPVSGSGTAFVITFKGKRQGSTSPITITYQKIVTRTGDVIPASMENGEIRVVAATQGSVTPTQLPPQLTPSSPTVPPVQPTTEKATPLPTEVPAMAPPTDTPKATSVPTQTEAPATPVPPNTVTPTPTASTAPTKSAQQPQATQPTLAQNETPPSSGGEGVDWLLVVAGLVGVLIVAGVVWGLRRAIAQRR